MTLGKPVMPADRSTREGSVSQWLILALFLVICLATAGLGAAWTNLSVGDWYAAIKKPTWNPPNWLFGPVWTALYIGMAVAAWLVWRKNGLADAWLPLLLFGVQLFLNAAWSALFFGMRSPAYLRGHCSAVVCNPGDNRHFWARFQSCSNIAGPVPRLGFFATVLNWSIWRMNP